MSELLTREQEARALIVELSKTPLVKGSGISEHAIDMVRYVLAARERAVWEEAAQVAEARFPAYDFAGAATILAQLFRERAKKAEPA